MILRARDLIDKGECVNLKGGMNNALYLINIDNQECVLKKYADLGAPLRLAREVAFHNMCEVAGVGNVPKLLDFDDINCLALFEYVRGNRVVVADQNFIAAAANFINTINKNSQNQSSPYFAKDALIELDYLLVDLANRVKKLKSCEIPIDAEAIVFGILEGVDNLLANSTKIEKEFERIQARNSRESYSKFILSPSDFGIHNSIQTESGVYFLDFEYSGKDSPLKLFGDFISHPQHLLKENLIRLFYELTKDTLCFELEHFSKLFLLLFRFKWCLIMCNPIVKPTGYNSKYLETLSEYYRAAVNPLL